MSITYRNMNARDIPAGMALVEAANWNQTAHEWELFLSLSPSGCFVAEADGRVVGTVTTLDYGPFAWISMVLVDPALRGQGTGSGLMRVAMERLAGVPCVRLDATPLGEPVYRKLGFEPEYGLVRLERPGQPAPKRTTGFPPLVADAIMTRDALAFDADRSAVLRTLAAQAPELCRESPGRGYILGRRGRRFVHLGPLAADDESAARELTLAVLPETGAVIDVPEERGDFIQFLKQHGFRQQRPLLRMCRGAAPPLRPQIYAITGPELG